MTLLLFKILLYMIFTVLHAFEPFVIKYAFRTHQQLLSIKIVVHTIYSCRMGKSHYVPNQNCPVVDPLIECSNSRCSMKYMRARIVLVKNDTTALLSFSYFTEDIWQTGCVSFRIDRSASP